MGPFLSLEVVPGGVDPGLEALHAGIERAGGGLGGGQLRAAALLEGFEGGCGRRRKLFPPGWQRFWKGWMRTGSRIRGCCASGRCGSPVRPRWGCHREPAPGLGLWPLGFQGVGSGEGGRWRQKGGGARPRGRGEAGRRTRVAGGRRAGGRHEGRAPRGRGPVAGGAAAPAAAPVRGIAQGSVGIPDLPEGSVHNAPGGPAAVRRRRTEAALRD